MEKKKFFIVRAYEWLDDWFNKPGKCVDWAIYSVYSVLGVGFVALVVYGFVTGRASLPSFDDLWTGAKWCVAGVAFLAVVSFFQYVCRSALLGLVLFFAVCALINHW